MPRYRKIDPRFWNDKKVRMLDDDAKFVFLFLLSHQHMTPIGAMRSTIEGLAAELGWQIKRFRAALQQLISLQMVEVNESASFISLPNFLKYNEPEGPNSVTKAWGNAIDLLPECPEKQRLMRRIRTYLEARSQKFKHAMGDAIWDAIRDAITDAKSEACHIQEQEQELEQEQEQKQEQEGGSGGMQTSAPSLDETTEDWIIEEWRKLEGVQQPNEITSVLRSTIRSRVKEHKKKSWWTEKFFTPISQSKFLTGQTEEPFHASLSWALGPKNLAKILEGRYANSPSKRSSVLQRIAELERQEHEQAQTITVVNP